MINKKPGLPERNCVFFKFSHFFNCYTYVYVFNAFNIGGTLFPLSF